VQGEQKFTSATSKPAPFAEKKSAKDAAPENSMSGLIGLRCDAGGFATRPDFSAQATGYAGGPYTNIECRKPQWQNTASAASTDRNGQRQRSGSGGDGGAVPFATARGMHFFGLGVGQSTLIRLAAVVPLISCTGVPTPTRSNTGGQSLKSKLP
jgi:hypothetical protein